MAIIKFSETQPLKPLFGVKLPPTVYSVLKHIPSIALEKTIKEALKIHEKRIIALEIVDIQPTEKAMIVVIYDYISQKGGTPKVELPEKNGYFDFLIYDLNFNMDIDIEDVVAVLKQKT